jgi:hypothetical protein
MRFLALLSFLILCSCKKTKEVETILSTFSIASYDFEVIEYKTIKKKTGEVMEQYVDTVLVNLDCELCEEICSEVEDDHHIRR